MTDPQIKERMGDYVIQSIGATINLEIDALQKSNTKINHDVSSTLLSTIEELLRINIKSMRFDSKSSSILRNSLERTLDIIPSFNNSSCRSLLKIFHMLDSNYKQSNTDKKENVLYPKILVRTLMENKINKSLEHEFIVKTFSYQYSGSSTNHVKFDSYFFKDIDAEMQAKWLSKLISTCIEKDDWNIHHWIRSNFNDLAKNAIRANNKSFCRDLVMFTLEYDQKKNEQKSEIYRFEFKNPKSSELIHKLREYVFGDIATFNRLLIAAQSLDCLNDKAFWSNVLMNKEISTQDCVSLDGIEL